MTGRLSNDADVELSRDEQPLNAKVTGGPFPVVAIGASAGGLEAARNLVGGLTPDLGIAFILVQHLDPNHESMMVDLLASYTSLKVEQAADGTAIEPNHLYIIPPGTYLSVANGMLRLSRTQLQHGMRMPFDHLLHSLASEYGPRAACIVLSGTGSDGSLGLMSIHEKQGLVIAQDPDEAAYEGMPRSAILTGVVDHVLPVAKMPNILAEHAVKIVESGPDEPDREAAKASLARIIELLRTKTSLDFTLYKPGTLQRRIERRMALSSVNSASMEMYLETLKNDPAELDLLAKDLLINVTSFFRDPKVFDVVAQKIIPEIVGNATADRPIRVWVAGCSTGEETYSLAMLFSEAMAASGRKSKLQIFASDVDLDAVAIAIEGLYSNAIEADITPERLARFFSKEETGYRILPELRAMVIFTVQDILADPPFSRLDMVSCRNLLIYLGPIAQAKVISLFHFALRDGGILLLGNAESIGNPDGRFEVVSKSDRIYRHLGRARPGEVGFPIAPDVVRTQARLGVAAPLSPQTRLAELCRRLVLESFAPPSVLINRKFECLYSLGPMDRYLAVVPGHPTFDLLAMARPAVRTKLRAAIHQAIQSNSRVLLRGGRLSGDDGGVAFGIDVRPVQNDGEDYLLICFIDEPGAEAKRGRRKAGVDDPRIAQLEQELDETRAELQGAIRNLEVSAEEQKTINEEALSVNEEFQSTNEELLTSKEELQSLNEELTALNSQLHETLERQRTMSNDLQNVLYSTDVATIFLDAQLHIRFFTPATRSHFNVIAGDIGRPLADLHPLADDNELLRDAGIVLADSIPIEREVEAPGGAWYIRRILPYRTHENGIEGVVITFADITERKRIADALEHARREAEIATVAKSRFLAVASHDLRQPLQTLTLLQGLLARGAMDEKQQNLVSRMDDTLGAMTGMLDTLLDINQIEAGVVRADVVTFPVNTLLGRTRDEFAYHAEAQRLELRTVQSGLSIQSDVRLLEQMIRNLLSNAFKYTRDGKVLLGCRRKGTKLSIEIWDTGIGIPDAELQDIFTEYHQLDNAAREHDRGLGLGLSIVKRLADLLGHTIRVRSKLGKGSMFAIEVPLSSVPSRPKGNRARRVDSPAAPGGERRTGQILVVEDDLEVRGLLEMFLHDEGQHTASAADGVAALEMVADGLSPDLILADYNLPRGINGLQLSLRLRDALGRQIPVIILTGDISTNTLRDIATQHCVQLHKPVRLPELSGMIQRLLPPGAASPPAPAAAAVSPEPAAAASPVPGSDTSAAVIFVVDDDDQVCAAIRSVLEEDGRTVETFGSSEAFLDAHRSDMEGCLIIDAYLPGMSGLELLQRVRERDNPMPAIIITGHSDVGMAVAAMKAGALDFIDKPVGNAELIASVTRALDQSRDSSKLAAERQMASARLAELTERQREIMDMVLAGQPSKNIAADLGISQRTVENHRAAIMRKTGSKSLPALARLALAARGGD